MAKTTRSRRRPDVLTSLVLVLPLLIFYETGVLFSDVMNGADVFTGALIRWIGLRGFIYAQLGLVVAGLGLAAYLRHKKRFDVRHFLPVLAESCLYAITMGTLIVFVMVDLLGIDPRLATGAVAKLGVFDRLVLSVGAGVHEELIFRLGLYGGLSVLFIRGLKLRTWVAIGAALAISSALFALAHHIGPLGEPLRLGVFTYRALAGLFFAALYQFRSFAIAVYTHAIYDIYVLLISS